MFSYLRLKVQVLSWSSSFVFSCYIRSVYLSLTHATKLISLDSDFILIFPLCLYVKLNVNRLNALSTSVMQGIVQNVGMTVVNTSFLLLNEI